MYVYFLKLQWKRKGVGEDLRVERIRGKRGSSGKIQVEKTPAKGVLR
jgi:hypothetical protein